MQRSESRRSMQLLGETTVTAAAQNEEDRERMAQAAEEERRELRAEHEGKLARSNPEADCHRRKSSRPRPPPTVPSRRLREVTP